MHNYAIIPPAAGTLLVAHPSLEDPNFARTVVYVIAHGNEGTFGLVLNRPNVIATPSFDSPLMPWWEIVAAPQMIFDGGPVDLDAVVCLYPDPTQIAGVRSLDVTWDDPQQFIGQVRIFQGYSGWSAGQLENELALEGWFVVPAQPEDVIDPEPELLWHKVLARQDNNLRRLADFPEDPGLN